MNLAWLSQLNALPDHRATVDTTSTNRIFFCFTIGPNESYYTIWSAQFCTCSPCNSGDSIHKLCLEENIGVVKHAIFERDHDELRVSEVGSQHLPNVLCVREVQGCIHLIKDIKRGWLEEQQRENERECHQRSERWERTRSIMTQGKAALLLSPWKKVALCF